MKLLQYLILVLSILVILFHENASETKGYSYSNNCFTNCFNIRSKNREWESYKEEYGKHYNNKEEDEKHRQKYFETVKEIEKHNERYEQKDPNYTYSRRIDEFTDTFPEENHWLTGVLST